MSRRLPTEGTFFLAPAWDEASPGVVFLGAPYDRTSADHPGGSKCAPAALRRASAQLPIMAGEDGKPLGWTFDALGGRLLAGVALWDGGDLELPADLPYDRIDRRVEQRVRQVLSTGGFPCTIGGEHALTRGALRAVAKSLRRPLALVVLDAHSDCGLSHWGGSYPRDRFVDGILEDGSADSILQVGLRDIHHPHNSVPRPGRSVLSPAEARRLGPEGLAALIPAGGDVYLSIDVDVLSPEAAPATRTPVPGGFGFDELLHLLGLLCRSPRLCALDLTELDPARDRDGLTVSSALYLLLSLLGTRFTAVPDKRLPARRRSRRATGRS